MAIEIVFKQEAIFVDCIFVCLLFCLQSNRGIYKELQRNTFLSIFGYVLTILAIYCNNILRPQPNFRNFFINDPANFFPFTFFVLYFYSFTFLNLTLKKQKQKLVDASTSCS